MTNYKEINDSAGSQDIVAQSNSFFISSTAWQYPHHYAFTSLPLNENDSNILTHYYILRKDAKHHPLTYLYIEELKKCLVPFKIGVTVQVAFRHVGSKI